MATLGTFTAGQVLTAAELNAIGTWQAWTPTITAQTGTPTTVTVNNARYSIVNKIVVFWFDIAIVNKGTATDGFYYTLPVTAKAGGGIPIGTGRERALTGGDLFSFTISSTQGALLYDNNTTVWANGATVPIFGMYEAL